MTEFDPRSVAAAWPVGGHYSHAISMPPFMFVAGQTAGTPGTSDLEMMDIRTQTARCVDRIADLLQEVGATLASVVKTTCFLASIEDFAAFDEAYANSFGEVAPARSTIQVGAFPPGLLVEIEAVAVVDR